MEKEKNLMFQMRTSLRSDVKKSYGFRCNLLVRRQETVFCEWKWY